MYGAPPRQTQVFFCIAHCEHTHPRYPKTAFLAHGVQRYVCTERQPRNPQHFFALCIANTPIPGIQKQLFWFMVCRGVCVRSATPETPIILSHSPLQTHRSHVSRNPFFAFWCAEVCVYRAPPQKPPVLFCIAHCKHTHPRYLERPFVGHGVQRYVCTERHPRNPEYCFALPFADTPIPGI